MVAVPQSAEKRSIILRLAYIPKIIALYYIINNSTRSLRSHQWFLVYLTEQTCPLSPFMSFHQIYTCVFSAVKCPYLWKLEENLITSCKDSAWISKVAIYLLCCKTKCLKIFRAYCQLSEIHSLQRNFNLECFLMLMWKRSIWISVHVNIFPKRLQTISRLCFLQSYMVMCSADFLFCRE